MQIDLFNEDSITFKITNNGDDVIALFYSVMNKCNVEAKKIGLNNMFNSEEKAFIKEFTDKIKGDEVKY
jgi:hypothetical protein